MPAKERDAPGRVQETSSTELPALLVDPWPALVSQQQRATVQKTDSWGNSPERPEFLLELNHIDMTDDPHG